MHCRAEPFAQCWGLDETGNWSNFREDNTGAGSWTLNQSRTSNTVNEITDITETVGASWVTPVYSRAGNMTTMPQPASAASSYTATYDAWNRLVKIVDGSNTVSEYAYDGAKRRVVQKSYVSGTLNETRHLYYTEPSRWQVVEERVGSSTSANRQFVWGLRYIDDLIRRDRDTDGNGTLDERLYSLQDANWNMTGLVSTSGAMQQRFSYTAYGLPVFLKSSFTNGSNTAGWEVLYAGYRFEAATSLMHVRHRVLNLAFGCWVQRDPIGYADGASMYQYVASTPYATSDATGQFANILIGGPAGCVVGGAWGAITSWWWNESWCQARCKAAIGCIAGGIAVVVVQLPPVIAAAEANPALAGCLIAAISSAVASQIGSFCDALCVECPPASEFACNLAVSILTSALSCAAGSGISGEASTILAAGLASIVGQMIGVTGSGVCSELSKW